MRCALHTLHSCAAISYGFRTHKVRHAAIPHSGLPPSQLPGTDVDCPCKKAWLFALRRPMRISLCTSCSHGSSVRIHTVSSVRPCTHPMPSCQKMYCPCALVAEGSYCLHLLIYSSGIAAIEPPFGGSNWLKSPLNNKLIPPKARSLPSKPVFKVDPLRTMALNLRSISARNDGLIMLISSMISQRHCKILSAAFF